jgi:RNA polymerase sigma-70 factor, ECF subfamily
VTVESDPSFEQYRDLIWGLAYRITGCAADADDVVQTTFQRALHKLAGDDRPARPWLVAVATNLGRDVLRARRRRSYTGPWLPTPVEQTPGLSDSPDARYDAKESASYAFMVALEALPPQKRAVLILRDVLDYSVAETASALEMSASNVKTTHHRARRVMAAYDAQGAKPSAPRHEEAIAAFLGALATRDIAQMEALLTQDVRMVSDGGGIFLAALKPVIGCGKVCRFLLGVTTDVDPATASFEIRTLNGAPSLLIQAVSSKPRTARASVMTLTLDASGQIAQMFLIINPHKLARLGMPGASAP